MQIKIKLDLENPAHVKGFRAMLDALEPADTLEVKGLPETTAAQPAKKTPSRAAAKPQATQNGPGGVDQTQSPNTVSGPGDAGTVEQPSNEAKMTVVKEPETVIPEPTNAAPNDDLLGDGQDAAPAIKIEDVRTLADSKINPEKNPQNFQANTQKLKAELTRVGAAKISTLEPSQFAAMLEFIKTLA